MPSNKTSSRFRRAGLPFLFCLLAGPNALGQEGDRPEARRFVKTTLSQGEFYEPTEMAVLPNLDVLITQRRGEILHYDASEEEIYRVGFLDAYFSTDAEGVNAEEGVLGIAADPDFASNHFVYIFYSPSEKSVNRLSRFVFKDRMLDMDSEKVVLEFFSQRDICCHTGGSLAFGPDRMLYLSTGDNSTPFDEKGAEHVNNGFAPLNELPGKEQFDARRSSSNTNDLRGKILRIRILPDGTYEIPEGNLFPATEKTRPEIFTMGHRNPYRISVDRKTGDVYWGDVGPDANKDLPHRGPRGYDEMNRATEAGYYGWPLFVGNSYPYRDFDYGTGKSGRAFDPQTPVNDSVNNTGLSELPPAQAPFIWYPYAESPDFPIVGSGGRNAMAGPVYHKEFYPESTRLVDYYDGKVVMYDWIRGWFIAVEFGPDGSLVSVEPFLENLEFAGPIDVELGPDGRLYVLEYGSGWFQQNPDSGLSRIDFIAGNLPPSIESVSVSKHTGKTPFTFEATAAASDYENDAITYQWNVGEQSEQTEEPRFTATLKDPGPYQLTLTATDATGSSATSNPVELYAGNEQPQVSITLKGNQTFYFPDRPVAYRVKLQDDAKVAPERAFVSAEMKRSAPRTELGHKVLSREDEGEILVGGSDCRACHKSEERSIGPSYLEVATRYLDDRDAVTKLSNKILGGGAGVWGEVAMPAHPSLGEGDVSKMVSWILAHAEAKVGQPSLPLAGKIDPASLEQSAREQIFTLQARYVDAPGAPLLPLTASATASLRPNRLNRYNLSEASGFLNEGPALAYSSAASASFRVEDVDLNGIRQVAVRHAKPVTNRVQVSVRVGGPEGPVIGSATLQGEAETRIKLKRPRDANELVDLHFSFSIENAPESENVLQYIEFLNTKN